MGRAISLLDMEAAASSAPGVRAVRADWAWNPMRQRPVVEIWYIGTADSKTLLQTLRALSDSVTPIAVDQATSVPATLALSIEIDPKRLESDVLAAVRAALTTPGAGMLSPELIGIGLPLFRSRIFDAVLSVRGAVAVTGILVNNSPFIDWAVQPGSGNYFDFENGVLLLNGKAS
jgi:hypothetical protein